MPGYYYSNKYLNMKNKVYNVRTLGSKKLENVDVLITINSQLAKYMLTIENMHHLKKQ